MRSLLVTVARCVVALMCVALLASTVPRKSWSSEQLTLPGGRSNYVFTLMAARYNDAFSRLSTWVFRTDGTIEERYWLWRQTDAPVTTNVYAHRSPSGYTTAGCPKVCDVWTATSFLPGTSPTLRIGSWSYTPTGAVHIVWGGTIHEYYNVTDHGTYTRLELGQYNYANVSIVYGTAFGSNWSLNSGVTMADVRAAGDLDFTLHSQNWDAVTQSVSGTVVWSQYILCTIGSCMQGSNPAVYHTYYANNPAVDGRKTYWYHQLASVGGNANCADVTQGGHTQQMLQAIDDNGQFIGFVGAEASLLGRKYGGSIVNYYVGVAQ